MHMPSERDGSFASSQVAGAQAIVRDDSSVWVRCGDAGGYHQFDWLDEAAEYLVEMGVRDALTEQVVPSFGYGTADFRGCLAFTDGKHLRGLNYISIFWGGDKAEDVIRGLTKAELVELNRWLVRALREGEMA
jgi:hypothetical protein